MMMAGLRERKKEQTRRRIAEVALRLFDERGYDAVTVNEVAEAAGVAKVTLFSYFPTKECLVTDGVKDDLAAVVAAGRRDGRAPLDALRAHFLSMAAQGTGEMDVEALLAKVRVIASSPALIGALQAVRMSERHELAAALAGAPGPDGEGAAPGDGGDLAAQLMAAQITAVIGTLQEAFFQRVAGGAGLEEAGRRLADDVELGFALLEHGFSHIKGENS
ncbi:Biofilm operon icaADBC HTH-type negative transcriptional regulator IcaR [Nonomuraea coxensis DSM 45129]|uniref:Biofilm operon icaADBC HTH-type negative transcriptional regulator IcaR n=1 Tax=Nonomuraea coxensis DSM 45129 TaxID=1122611 RepID=A0ABX8TZ17_9ACTN|nr:TetR/AcrR family transcriptional regulator [Nonomuraea coxensis]QYC40496.1 Biofilm operon icaADBC HTH-type negative transcriptional regulator IcaR [Nonomuraea coxensis DSM 45129]